MAGVSGAGLSAQFRAEEAPACPAGRPKVGVGAVPAPGAAPPRTPGHWGGALAIAGLIVLLNLAVWRAFNPPLAAPEVPTRVAGVAYNAFQRWDSPLARRYPSEAQLAADLRLLAGLTGRLRTYSTLELPGLPDLAQAQGLKVAAGVWLDRRFDNNEREVAAAIEAARLHASVERVIAGNETQLHRTLSPAELYGYLDRLSAALAVPVSTAEPWHIWLSQPELAAHVDFITVHLLPYWEGVPVEAALDEALRRLAEVAARFPDKPVVIGEIGWPSGGDAVKGAEASPDAQALFVRRFLARPEASGLDYYLMEAIDQPWKRATEGAVGAHWGLYDAARRAKFALTGPVEAEPYWRGKALISSALGLAGILPFLLAFRRMRLAGRLAFALSAQAVASFSVLLGALPLLNYLGPLDAAVLAVLVPALVVMAAILLAQTFEFAELFWEGSLRRRAQPLPASPGAPLPFVSIHLACSNEPPEMVIATIDSLLALDWPAFEVLVVDNNTRDPALWQPVQRHVEARLAARTGRRRIRPCTGPGSTFLPPARLAGLQGGRPELRPGADRSQCRLGRGGGCGLPGAAGLAQGPGRPLRGPGGGHSPGAPGPSRLGRWAAAAHDELGVRGLLPHRHAPPPRTGRHSAARHHDPDPGGGPEARRRLGHRLRVRGHRAGAARAPAGAERRLCGPRPGLRPGAHGLRRLPPPAPALGPGGHADPAQACPGPGRALAPDPGSALPLRRRLAALVRGRPAPGLQPRGHGLDHRHPGGAPRFGVPMALFIVPLAVFFLARLVLGPLLYWRRVPCAARDILGAALAGMGLSHSIASGVIAGLAGGRAVFDVTRKGPVPAQAGPVLGKRGLGLGPGAGGGGPAAGVADVPGRAGLEPGPEPRVRRQCPGGLDGRAGDAGPALCRRHRLRCAVQGRRQRRPGTPRRPVRLSPGPQSPLIPGGEGAAQGPG